MPLIQKAAIFGAAGSIGPYVAAEFERRGIPFRAIGRDRQKLETAFRSNSLAEIFPADISDLRSASAAARGVDTIIYCVGLPYPSHHLHPALMRTTLDAAIAMQVRRIVLVSSVYPYGVPRTAKVAETHLRQPGTRKGQFRKEQEDLVLEASAKGQIDGLIVRLPDFYGPGAELSLAHQVFSAAVQGRTTNWIGPVNTKHEFIYTPDAGPIIADLANCEDCYGQPWNVAGPEEINTLDFITRVYRAVGKPPKYRTVGPTILKIMGWFNPLYREVIEMIYLQERPVLLDDIKLRTKFPHLKKTPYDEGIRKTLDSYQTKK